MADLPELPTGDCEGSSCDAGSYAVIPIKGNAASDDPTGPYIPGSDACPDVQASFYSLIIGGFTVPAVNASVCVSVCKAGYLAEGMWIKTAVGKFRVTRIFEGDGKIQLTNSCPDGSAVEGNSDPGTVVTSNLKFWVVDHNCDENIGTLLDSHLETKTELCLPDMADQGEAEKVLLWGGTAEDPCGASNTNCSRVVTKISAEDGTLAFQDPLTDDTELDTYDAVFQQDACAPEGFKLKRRSIASAEGVDVICGGKNEFKEVPSDWQDKQYALRPNPTTGCPEWREQSEQQIAWHSTLQHLTSGVQQTLDLDTLGTLPSEPFKIRVTADVDNNTGSSIQVVIFSGAANERSTMAIGALSGAGNSTGTCVWEVYPRDNRYLDYQVQKSGGSDYRATIAVSAILLE